MQEQIDQQTPPADVSEDSENLRNPMTPKNPKNPKNPTAPTPATEPPEVEIPLESLDAQPPVLQHIRPSVWDV